MSRPIFFAEYKDTLASRVLAAGEALALLLFSLFFINAPETYAVRNIATVYFGMMSVGFIIIIADSLKENNKLVSHAGLGSGWRAVWGIGAALVSGVVLVYGANLSFIGRGFVAAVSPSALLFWFLVVVGPRTEETFRNVLTPTLTRMLCTLFPRVYGDLLGFSSVLFMAGLFAAFHYFTYMQLAGTTGSFSSLILFAFAFGVFFSLGNYLFKTDEFSKTLHVIVNFKAYTSAYPIDLPLWQYALLFGMGFLILTVILIILIPRVKKLVKRK